MLVAAPDHVLQYLAVNICQPVDVEAGGACLVLAEGCKLRPGIGSVCQPVLFSVMDVVWRTPPGCGHTGDSLHR